MVAGADSIDDLGVIRHETLPRLFAGIRAPSTLGTFLRGRSRACRFRKPVWLITVRAGTEEVWHGPRRVDAASSATRQCARDRAVRLRTRRPGWGGVSPAPSSHGRRPQGSQLPLASAVRARCSGDRQRTAGSHGDTDRHSQTNTPTRYRTSEANPTVWRVKDRTLEGVSRRITVRRCARFRSSSRGI